MTRTATLYRMKTDKHICPYGLKARHVLRNNGFKVNDVLLRSREETDAFKEKHGVRTTPQVFVSSKRIGGYDNLREYLGLSSAKKSGTSYTPVIAVFAVAALMAICITLPNLSGEGGLRVLEVFVAFSMCILSILKLRDLNAFTTQFITYDLIAMRRLRYALLYPFLEAYVGLAMLGKMPAIWFSPVALMVGGMGAISVVKAVYIDKRELKCACVGGNSNVPLGFVSLCENLFMFAAAIWMWL